MMQNQYCYLDFESEEAVDGTGPPRPIGMSLMLPGREPEWFAWGFASGNNCTQVQAVERLRDAFANYEIAAHNALFDLSVAYNHLGGLWPAKPPHCTLTAAFLVDPYGELGLKELYTARYGLPADASDRLREWVVTNIPQAACYRKNASTKWRRFISLCPGDVVAEYAKADVAMPARLLIDLVAEIDTVSRMREAYEREMALLPCLVAMTLRGVTIDVSALERAVIAWKPLLECSERNAQRLLGRRLNLGSGSQLIAALEAADLVDRWIEKTPTGRPTTTMFALRRALKKTPRAAHFLEEYGHWKKLSKYLATWPEPWLKLADSNNRIYPTWNPIRQEEDGGARTGRFSSKPATQNIPKEALLNLPDPRLFIIAPPEHTLIDLDYRQQELVVLAAAAAGQVGVTGLRDAYRADPDLDMHEEARRRILKRAGVDRGRKLTKAAGFMTIYGAGPGRLARVLGIAFDDAEAFQREYRAAMPEIAGLDRYLQNTFRQGGMFETWGGRVYGCEPSKEGMRYTYKALNYQIQGSAADITKTAMIRAHDSTSPRNAGVELILTVHDQIVAVAKRDQEQAAMKRLRDAMEIEFDPPLRTDPKLGTRWGALKKFDENTQ